MDIDASQFDFRPEIHGGWLGIDEIQRAHASSLPSLASIAPHLLQAIPQDASRDPILLYRAWIAVLGKYPDYPAQQIGDCVSFGHGHGNDLLQAIEISLGEASEYRETDTEFIYATSREIAGILGGQDGSYGAAAVKAMQQLGLLSREMLGSEGAYSGQRAKAWGWWGVSPEVKAKASPFKLGGAALVSSWDELVAAVAAGYPVTICTRLGFMLQRDAQGFCSQSGQWGHCMLIGALRFDRPGACVLQSWGPRIPSGPLALDQPSFSFWVDRAVIEAILREGDSWALSRAPEFVARPLPKEWNFALAA